MTPIQYGQEMRDQTGVDPGCGKWDYELRYPEQVASLVDRGMAITKSAPAGPVYLGLPREPLAEPWPDGRAIDNCYSSHSNTTGGGSQEAVLQAARWLEKAHHPLIICQRGDPGGRLSQVLSDLSANHAIPVVENFSVQNLLPSAHPCKSGFDAGTWLKDADIVLAIDTKFHGYSVTSLLVKAPRSSIWVLTLCSPGCPPGVIKTISQLCRTR